jgi:hypothetical protein
MIIIRAKATATRGLARSKLCRHDLQAARNNSRLPLRVASSTIILHTIASEPFLHCCTASRCNTGLCQPHFPPFRTNVLPTGRTSRLTQLCQPRHPITSRQKAQNQNETFPASLTSALQETAPQTLSPTPRTLNPPLPRNSMTRNPHARH